MPRYSGRAGWEDERGSDEWYQRRNGNHEITKTDDGMTCIRVLGENRKAATIIDGSALCQLRENMERVLGLKRDGGRKEHAVMVDMHAVTGMTVGGVWGALSYWADQGKKIYIRALQPDVLNYRWLIEQCVPVGNGVFRVLGISEDAIDSTPPSRAEDVEDEGLGDLEESA